MLLRRGLELAVDYDAGSCRKVLDKSNERLYAKSKYQKINGNVSIKIIR